MTLEDRVNQKLDETIAALNAMRPGRARLTLEVFKDENTDQWGYSVFHPSYGSGFATEAEARKEGEYELQRLGRTA